MYQQESTGCDKKGTFKGFLAHFNKKVSHKNYRTLPALDHNLLNLGKQIKENDAQLSANLLKMLPPLNLGNIN